MEVVDICSFFLCRVHLPAEAAMFPVDLVISDDVP